MKTFEHLNQPITFRGMTVKNRIFLPPMKTNYIREDHTMSEDIIGYYEEMAKGGIGLITTEAAQIDGDRLYDGTIPGIYDDSQIDGFSKPAEVLHRYGTRLFVQLTRRLLCEFSRKRRETPPLLQSHRPCVEPHGDSA